MRKLLWPAIHLLAAISIISLVSAAAHADQKLPRCVGKLDKESCALDLSAADTSIKLPRACTRNGHTYTLNIPASMPMTYIRDDLHYPITPDCK